MNTYTRKNALTTSGGVELATPAKRAKQLGCESLQQVIEVSGVSRQTLRDWFKSRPFVFEAVCLHVAATTSD